VADSSVRRARLVDVENLAQVQFDSWPLTPGLSEAARSALDLADTTRSWERAVVAPPSPRHSVWVALDDEQVVGFAALAPADDPDLDYSSTTEVIAFAVDPKARRQGHGSRLLHALVAEMRDEGQLVAVAWVNAQDDLMRSFLESSGWAPDGAFRALAMSEDEPEADGLRQVRLGTDLTIDEDTPSS
jgi:GNAT superfamily N-acetyltransferase